jgi:hypothetical protein
VPIVKQVTLTGKARCCRRGTNPATTPFATTVDDVDYIVQEGEALAATHSGD